MGICTGTMKLRLQVTVEIIKYKGFTYGAW